MVVLAGVDYARVLAAAEAEADIIIWDGGNNDFPFFRPDLLITVVDPLRAGDELSYHPGELNLRMADVVVVNKVDAAEPAAVRAVLANVASVRPGATVVMAASPVALAPGPALAGARVLVVEDGPSVTHGGMPFGAGTVAAREAGATTFVDPRPYAAGAIAAAYAHYPSLGAVLPALGYTPSQLADLQRTVDACPFDVAVIGTPIDLARVVRFGRPTRRASYELAELGSPTLADALAPFISHWASTAP